MYTQKSSTLNIELTKSNQPKSMATSQPQADLYKQQQAQIESQQFSHMMAQQQPLQQSATHFFAGLLQNPAVLANPELMASVASMLQSSLANPAMGMAPIGSVMPMPQMQSQFPVNGNCFRNFSIPNSESSSQLRSIIESSICGSSDHAKSQRSSSINSGSSNKDLSVGDSNSSVGDNSFSEKFSHTSSDQDSTGDHSSLDQSIKIFRNSNDLVVNKVMKVIEEILASDNIKKNNFLAKLFEEKSSDANGRPEILIKRIAGFKRVKAITMEFKAVQAAIRESSMFEISGDDLSAFRNQPLPDLSQKSTPSLDATLKPAEKTAPKQSPTPSSDSQKDQKVVKKILAINFTQENFTIEKMTQIFEQIGEIAQISLIRPNKKIPEYLAEYSQWVPDLGSKPCAVIDFENQESAQNACREINMSQKGEDATGLIRCALLKPGARIKRTLYRKYNSTTSSEGSSISSSRASSRNGSNNSRDSGVSQNETLKKQANFNRKDVKKAISKHFISLGAYKGEEMPMQVSQVFVRQPKGPVSDQGGFSGDYQRSRMC